MNYNDDFRTVVKTGNYIGTGNPNAKILVIGCECAIGKNNDQYKAEIEDNAHNWQLNIDNVDKGVDVEIKDNCSSINPLYPYKGQTQKWYREKRDNNGNIIKRISEGGTSRTWLNYQKLHNEIFVNSVNNNAINFHENFFITEFSTITALSKRDIITDKDLRKRRKDSIEERTAFFSNYEFYQNFPIVIVATGGAPYINKDDGKLCTIFNVDYKEIENDKVDNIYYHIHRNKIGKSPKLIIHTWQFGGNISNNFLGKIADLCLEFTRENEINLKID